MQTINEQFERGLLTGERTSRPLPLLLDQAAVEAAQCQLTTAELHATVELAWADIRSGRARGGKSVLSLPEEDFWRQSGLSDWQAGFAGERLGWKLSCLYSAGPHYAGVKVIGANAFNRVQGLPRSTSTFILMEKLSMQPIAIVDATELSAARTGVYASTFFGLADLPAGPVEVFLFGAGPIAGAILEALSYSAADRISRVYLRSRRLERAHALVSTLATSLPFPLEAVADNLALRRAGLVITATNAKSPVFDDTELRPDAALLHLGGDEVPEATLRRILKHGQLGCDDLATVSRRGSQSLALQFSRNGGSLEALGPHLGILSFQEPIGGRCSQGLLCPSPV